MIDVYYRHKKQIDRVLFFALITVSVFLFFTALFDFLAPFFFGLLIALLMNPLVNFLMNKMKMKRWLASLLSLLIFMAAMSSMGVWLISTLFRQVGEFIESAPTHVEEIVRMLEDGNLWLERASESLPEGWYMPDIQELGIAAVTAFIDGGLAGQAISMVGNVPNLFINVILALVSAYFFMSDRERIFKSMRNACPKWIAGQWGITKAGLRKAMAGYFKAQAILMVMVGVISITGLLILGNDYALFVGLLLSILDFLPILGPAVVLLPWALISLVIGNFHQAIGLVVIYGVITIARQVLQPKIMGSQMGVHPLASLMSIFIGFRIFGLLGFILGPSLLMIFKAVKEANQDALYQDE